MKRWTKIILVITMPILTIIIGLISLIIYNNLKYDKKEILTIEEFQNIMEKYTDNKEDITDKYDLSLNVKKSTNTKKDDFEVTYIIFEKDEDAKKYFEKEKEYIKATTNEFHKFNYIGLKSYGTFTLSSKNRYVKLLRLKNSIVCIFGRQENKNEIKNIIKELNY